MFVQLNEDNRIIGTADHNCFPEDTNVLEYEFPENFNFDNQYEYLIVDGILVESESEETKQQREENSKIESRTKFINEAPDIIAEQDDAICALYEENLTLKSTANDVDDAICYLYEQLTRGEE